MQLASRRIRNRVRNGKREEQLLTEGNQSVTFIGPKPEKESKRGIIMRLPKEAEATLSG